MPPSRWIEVRWHGRGGQGVVLASELLAKAVIHEGRWAQSFPMFGPERRGAPVLAFTRVGDTPITIYSGIYEPDVVAVLDRTLPFVVDVKSGLKEGGVCILNATENPASLRGKLGLEGVVLATVDATRIALDTLRRPITNTPVLGALAKVTGLVRLESLTQVVRGAFKGELGARNAEAIERAYGEVVVSG